MRTAVLYLGPSLVSRYNNYCGLFTSGIYILTVDRKIKKNDLTLNLSGSARAQATSSDGCEDRAAELLGVVVVVRTTFDAKMAAC